MTAAKLIAGCDALVFDLDGTLADTRIDLWLSLNSALNVCGLPPVASEVALQGLHGGLTETARHALRSLRADAALLPALARQYASQYRSRNHAASVLYEGVPGFLDHCRDRGLILRVCTNKARKDAADLLAKLGIDRFFKCVVGADTAGHPKPHPAPLLHALETTDAKVTRALLIGDSHVDAECAARAGVPFVFHAEGYCGSMPFIFPVAARFHKYAELSERRETCAAESTP